MESEHRLVQDQNISPKGRTAPGSRVRRQGKTTSFTPAKTATIVAATATVTEWNVQHLAKVAADLDIVIGKCLLDPEVETVHRLRTGSRRVQATVETIVRQTGASAKSIVKPAKAWLRSIRNIRRAAGPVRDLDVHRKLLEKSQAGWAPGAAPATLQATDEPANGSRSAEAADGSAGNANRLSSQAKTLDDWLKDNRHAHAETLRKKIKKARQKLEQRREAFQSALQLIPALALKFPRSPGLVALEDFVRVVDAMPSLDSGNLHDFRKLTKKARYVAESGQEQSSQTIAKALKSVQDAIGDWHDWECLAEEAEIALDKDGGELTAWLEGRAEHFLAVALRTTERVRGQLLGEWMAAKAKRQTGKTASAPRKAPALATQTGRVKRPGATSRVA